MSVLLFIVGVVLIGSKDDACQMIGVFVVLWALFGDFK